MGKLMLRRNGNDEKNDKPKYHIRIKIWSKIHIILYSMLFMSAEWSPLRLPHEIILQEVICFFQVFVYKFVNIAILFFGFEMLQ